MNNLEWIYENDRDKLVSRIVGDLAPCDFCDSDKDYPACKGDCDENVMAWLMAEHDGDAHSKAQSKDAPNLSDLFGILSDEHSTTSESGQREQERDSREKLEADIREYWYPLERIANTSIGWLDRQEAITERKQRNLALAFQTHSDKVITELQARVDELEREREFQKKLDREAVDFLKGKIEALEADKRNWQDGYYLAKLAEAEGKVEELTASLGYMEKQRDYWKLHADCWSEKYAGLKEGIDEPAAKTTNPIDGLEEE